MKSYLHYSPFWLKALFPKYHWRIETKEKVLYLTFDDGPIPEVTEFVLDTLNSYQALATFFCIGDNVNRHPHIYKKLLNSFHRIGNHTYNHLNGWKSDPETYIENFHQCNETLQIKTNLFRPPHGRLTRQQANQLPTDTKVIMWDVLSGDFDNNLGNEKCLRKSIEHTKRGSIVVFHDSLKAKENLYYTLPRYLDHFSSLGYRFETLPY
jgi:peptidoglycan/xylan/chitin deacetylase (PgdA/CDA1 family)